jgi:cytochrome c oxidase subunit 1
VVLAVGYLLPLGYLAWSLFYGERAPSNPWSATGLEWTTPSPPATENFPVTPVVTEEPYQYKQMEAAAHE